MYGKITQSIKNTFNELETVEKVEDKIIKLQDTKLDITAVLAEREKEIKNAAHNRGANVYIALTGAGALAAVSTAFISAPVLLPASIIIITGLTFVTGLIFANSIAKRYTHKYEQRLHNADSSAVAQLEETLQIIDQKQTLLINEHTTELAQSPKLVALLGASQSVQKAFAIAAAKKITETQQPAPTVSSAQPSAGV